MEKDINVIDFQITLFLCKLGELQSEINNRCIAMLEKYENRFKNEIEADEELIIEKRHIIVLQQRALKQREIIDSLIHQYVDISEKEENKEQ